MLMIALGSQIAASMLELGFSVRNQDNEEQAHFALLVFRAGFLVVTFATYTYSLATEILYYEDKVASAQYANADSDL